MAVKISYTHIYDKIVAFLFKIPTSILLFFLCGYLIIEIEELLRPDRSNETLNILIGISIFIMTFFFSSLIYTKIFSNFYHFLSAYLYVRLSLRTPLNWGEVKEIAWIFVPNELGVWYPMKGVKKLPKKERKQFIIEFVNQIQ